jgi:transcription elongation factor GreA
MTQYLSKQKLEELKKELEERKTKIREEIGMRIKNAKELGDLSENADYSVAKDDLSKNERRILELEEILHSAKIIDSNNSQKKLRVEIGSKVMVIKDGEKKQYTIVGAFDSNPLKNLISNESPIGKAFLGKKVGDEVEFETPGGLTKYIISSIE